MSRVQGAVVQCPGANVQSPKGNVQNVHWLKAGKGKNRCDGVGVGMEQKEGERGEVVG